MPIQYGEVSRSVIPFDNGICITIQYSNGYGASVICHDGSYGGKRGLFEIAVLRDNDLCYDTEITGDVIGHLDFGEVSEILKKISELPEVPRPHN